MLSEGFEFLLKGGWCMYPLFLMAVISVAVMIERFITLRRVSGNHDALLIEVRRLLQGGNGAEALALCERTPGPVAALIASGIRNRHLDADSIERSMEELALRETPELSRRLGVLDTIITMAPLIGLLGTITGMIKSFNIVGSSVNNPNAITGGVGEALIATAAGLTVAIVTLPAYNYFTERVKEIIAEMETRATQLLNILANMRASEAKSVDANGAEPGIAAGIVTNHAEERRHEVAARRA